ncbi:MAG: hypothetical protein EXR92_00035 [Gemmatimonadetes bacterium]|nr:hypothetical protein [Gemmatimonadota bacterium]
MAAFVLSPTPVSAQFAAVETFLRNVTDLSFYGGVNQLTPSSDKIRADKGRLASFGVEMLFEIGGIDAPPPPAPPAPPGDGPRMLLRRIEVRRENGPPDSLFVYEPAPPPAARRGERIWTFEMGIGYGQIVGFELRPDPAHPNVLLRGAERDLPAASVYISYDPLGLYAGVRTGLMKVQGLQVVYSPSGASAEGTGESFLAGVLAGYSHEFGGVNLFLESAYVMRHFPSITWKGDPTIKDIKDNPALTAAPRDLQLSGLSLSTGLQISIAR